MKSVIAVVFALCLGTLLVSLALVASPEVAPTARSLLVFGNRNHHDGWYNVKSSSSSSEEERARDRKLKAAGYDTDIQSDGRKVVLVANEQERAKFIANIGEDAKRKGKSASKAIEKFVSRHELRVSAPRKEVVKKHNGESLIDERFFN
jgi:hypothetical protein